MGEDGIITHTVYPEVPPHVEYALSDLGESMRPILAAIKEWNINYKKQYEKSEIDPTFYLFLSLKILHNFNDWNNG